MWSPSKAARKRKRDTTQQVAAPSEAADTSVVAAPSEKDVEPTLV